MTKIQPYHLKASGLSLAQAIKSFRKGGGPVTSGMEMERFILTKDGRLPDAQTHDRFYLSLIKALGDMVSIEPGAHMIEIKTGVHTDAASLSGELNRTLATLKRHASAHGLKVQPASDLPGFTVKELASNLVSSIDPATGASRRPWELVQAYRKHGWNAISDWGCATTSIQFTHSVEDADQLHRWARVHAALMPLYYTVFENRERQAGVHNGLFLRRSMKERGLVANYVFEAADGGDFVDRYIDFAMNNRIITYLDGNGHDVPLPEPATFGELPENARTLGNLLHAASLSWNVCKIKHLIDSEALKDGEVRLSHLLLEVRDMDVSDRAIPAIAGWLCALTRSEDTLAEAELRLEALGVPVIGNSKLAGERTRAALHAVETDPRYLETPFGEGVRLREAIREIVLPMLKQDSDPANALPLWRKMAEAREPVFRAKAAPGPSPKKAFEPA